MLVFLTIVYVGAVIGWTILVYKWDNGVVDAYKANYVATEEYVPALLSRYNYVLAVQYVVSSVVLYYGWYLSINKLLMLYGISFW